MKTYNVHFIISATNYYLQDIDVMCKSIHNLLSDDEISNYNYYITLITNKDNELLEQKINIFNTEILNNYNKYKIESIDIEFCPDFPWPVMTLYKPWLCNKYINEEKDDFVWCGNCNLEFESNDKNNWFNKYKINVSWHHKHPAPYYNDRPYYIQGGFVLADAALMKKLCEVWQAEINYHINHEYKVPQFHDETILNVLYNNENMKELFNPNFIFYVDIEEDNRMKGSFAKILYKNKHDNMFKRNYVIQ